MQETWIQFLGQEDPLEKEMATHSSIFAWRIPMDRGAWQSTVQGVARVEQDLATKPPATTKEVSSHYFFTQVFFSWDAYNANISILVAPELP